MPTSSSASRAETALGSYGYEAVDTKLARNEARPSHVLQLCFYSACIEQIQGVPPALMHLQLGSGRRESLRPRDFDAYFARAQRSLERFVDDPPQTVPYPCAACAQCDFRARCEREWRAKDDLSFVAGIRHSQAVALEHDGVATLAALGEPSAIARVRSVPAGTLAGLHEQAELQVATRTTGSIATRLRPLEEGRGFALLPLPSRLDMAIDLEGDPFWRADRELTFMFGLLERAGDGWTYRADWAHDEIEEAGLAGRVIDAIHGRLRDDPAMHVYHYGAVEVSVLKRLCMLNATHEEPLDILLRRHVFVDVVQAVRQAMRIGLESYGLKAVEKLPRFERTADVGRGADAVLEYEHYLADRDAAHLEAIERYNDEDCRATVAVVDWLRGQAPSGVSWLVPIDGVIEQPAGADLLARDLLRQELVEGEEPGSERWLAGELLAYHRRAAKPQWWAYYARQEMTTGELVSDSEAIAQLVPHPTLPPEVVVQSLAHPLVFPPQEHKVGPGTYLDAESGATVTVERLDEDVGIVWIKRGKRRAEPLPRAIVPGKPISMRVHADALERLAIAVRDGSGAYPAPARLLRNDLPVLAGREPGAEIQTTDLDELRAIALGLDSSTLVLQGPPGTGKTYTGARLITELVRQGKRVGITALGHKAIDNLCEEIERAAVEERLEFAGTRHGGEGHHEGTLIMAGSGGSYPESAVVAATSWFFARGEDHLDYLVIDEAGQFALADALACGTSADNLILLGDPSQLSQVVQGTHPPGIGGERPRSRARRAPDDSARPRHLPRRLLAHAPGDLLVHLARVLRRPAGRASVLQRALDERRRRPPHAPGRARRERLALARGGARHSRTRRRAAGRDAHGRARYASDRRRRHHGRDPIQRPGSQPARRAARRACRDGRQVPGPGGPDRLLLDGELERRGRTARRRLPLLAQPPERRDLARAVARLPRLQPAPARHARDERRGHAARQHALPARRGHRRGQPPLIAAITSTRLPGASAVSRSARDPST